MRALAVVPARFASTRFPGKPLALVLGKPMIQWVVERASRIRGIEGVLVATDDERIVKVVLDFGGRAVLTSSACPSGTDRIWEAAREWDGDVLVNLQGDEPALEPRAVEALLELMASDPTLSMGTLAAPLDRPEDYQNPDVVKVVLGEGGRCLYFSRSPVPHLRDAPISGARLHRHVGVYAYRRTFLEAFTRWPEGVLEGMERLEQLRALEKGVVIRAVVVRWPGCGVDRPEDVARAEAALRVPPA
ncbi:MAG: 3-deoxy-manno-octulosonate cytidylyltransferase [Acidobacteriota bacterium]